MTFEPFVNGNTLIHRLDPRIKIIVAFLFSILLAISQRESVLLSGLGIAVVFCMAARLNFESLVARMAALNIFLLLLWFVLPFTTIGNKIFSLGPLVATDRGIELALTISIKSNAILLFLTAFLGTSSIVALAHAMDHLPIPRKLVQLVYFTWRYIHEISKEIFRLRRAMKVRCFSPKTDLHTYRSFAYLLSTLLVRSFDRSERIYDAMVLRGFEGMIPALCHPVLQSKDIFISIVMLFCLIGLGVMEWTTITQ